jgi:hypothetical protein
VRNRDSEHLAKARGPWLRTCWDNLRARENNPYKQLLAADRMAGGRNSVEISAARSSDTSVCFLEM